jgi:hypothetical protein
MCGWFVDSKIKDERGYPKTVPCLDTSDKIQKHLDVIKNNLEHKENVIIQLRDRIKELEDEHYKDKRLQELTEELNKVRADARRGFSIEAKESEAIAAWKKEHDTKIHNNPNQYHGVSGGGYTYQFYPTGIGTFGECFCGACHRKAFKEAAGDVDKYSELMKSWNASISFDDV